MTPSDKNNDGRKTPPQDMPPEDPIVDPFTAPPKDPYLGKGRSPEDPARHPPRPRSAETGSAPPDPAPPPRASAASSAPTEPRPADASAPPPETNGRSGGLWSLLLAATLGGLVGAALLWFALTEFSPQDGPDLEAALAEQESRAAERDARLGRLESDLAAVGESLGSGESGLADMAASVEAQRTQADERFASFADTLDAIAARLDALEARLVTGEERISAIESRPVVDPDESSRRLQSEIEGMRQQVSEAAAAAQDEVARMRDELARAAEEAEAQIADAELRGAEAAQAQIEEMRQELARAAAEAQAELANTQEQAAALEAEAVAAVRLTEARAALDRVLAALDSGQPYAEPLSELQARIDAEVPEPLAAEAEAGVPTLPELRAAFPPAARAALRETAVVRTEGAPADRMLAFLRTQTQARSLAPREGDDADAILSRAEAALGEGDLDAALAELETLPEDGRAAMQDWLASARTRTEAVAAARSVEQTLN